MLSSAINRYGDLDSVIPYCRQQYDWWVADLQRASEGKPPLHPAPRERNHVYYARRSRRAMRRRAMWGIGPIE